MKTLIVLVGVSLLGLLAGCTPSTPINPTEEIIAEDEQNLDEEISSENFRLNDFSSGDSVDASTGITLTGTAIGPWYFEGVFSVQVRDEEGTILAEVQVVALEDWMTTDWVEFEVSIPPFETSGATTGVLRFIKANPSGLPENEDFIEVQVRFDSSALKS